MTDHDANLTLVLTGGGALAAYQVGFLRALARRRPDLQVTGYTGVSAGAINAAYLANHGGSFHQAVEDLTGLWKDLTLDQIFRVDPWSLAKNAAGWGLKLLGGHSAGVRGLVDTAPLRRLLRQRLTPGDGILHGLRQNLAAGRTQALAITGTNYATGQTVTWVQGRKIPTWDRPHRRSVPTEITTEHILASSAIPLVFPAVRIGSAWFGDGSIRQAAPLSPALHLGAKRILAISTRYEKSMAEADLPAVPGYPPPAQVLGTLVNAIFLDVLDRDARQLEKINDLLARFPGPPPDGLRPVKLFLLRPSRDLGRFAGEFEKDLPLMFRFLGRRVGTHRTASPDWLSMVLFEPPYLHQLIGMGEADAEARIGELEMLLN